MPRTRFDWIVITLIVAVLGSVWIGVTRVKADQPSTLGEETSPDIGHRAPDFTLETPQGTQIALSDYRGQPVLINFWATWCPPCRAEIPALEQVWRDTGGDIVILGVDVQESRGQVVSFMSAYHMTYPVVMDTDASIAQMYRVRAFPTTYFVDERGVIVDVYTGPLNEPLMYTQITKLTGQ